MMLSKEIRESIASQLIRIVAPVLIFAIALGILSTILLAPGQMHRNYGLIAGLIALIPAWIFSSKGKPLIGAHFLLASFVGAIATGMYVSGGVQAPIYRGVLSLIAVVVCLFGIFKSIIFAASMILLGAIFLLLEQQQLLPSSTIPPSLFVLTINSIWLLLSLCLCAIPVSMLQKALNAKESAEEELQSIINNTPDIIYRLDPEGRITFISDAVKRYGYTPDDFLGNFIMDFIHPEDRSAVHRGILERRTQKRGAKNIEVRFITPSQRSGQAETQFAEESYITCHVSSAGLYTRGKSDSEAYLGVQGVARDISKAKHYKEQANTLAAVIEQAAEDVVITDPQGVIKYVNPTFEHVTGYSKTEVIGKTPRILRSGKHGPTFYAELWQTITSGKVWKDQIWNKTKDGGLILQDVTITPIHDASNKLTGYASVRRDITLQNRIQEQLQQAQKMEAIGTLAGGIAHDFNNILAGMIGYTELALAEIKTKPSATDKLERVLEAGNRATELVKQILSFSRSQKKEPTLVSPRRVTQEVLKLMRASLPSTIEIKQTLNSESHVFADATNVHQILMNLCTNAGHAMREKGGVLSVRLEDVDLDETDAARYAGLVPGKYLKISVQDTGHGIPEEIRKRVFEPFFTTKPMGEGTGMGLAAVHGIVTELNGAVTLYSEIGRGTVFDVLIPVMPEPPLVENPIEREPLIGGTERILFIDDEKVQIDLARESLGRMGYRVNGFTDSAAALAHFQQNPELYDLIITDMTMPKMTGDILVKKIRLSRPDIPVIMCTGFSENIDEKKAKTIHIDAFLHKPVIIRDLLHTIRNVLDKKSVV